MRQSWLKHQSCAIEKLIEYDKLAGQQQGIAPTPHIIDTGNIGVNSLVGCRIAHLKRCRKRLFSFTFKKPIPAYSDCHNLVIKMVMSAFEIKRKINYSLNLSRIR